MGYGVSIKLNEDNDFAFDPVSNRLTLVSETDNLVQAIKILLKTGLREIRHFPTFGIDMPTLLDRNLSNDIVKNAVYNAIIKDPRVASIDKITINKVNRVLNIYVQLTANDGATLDFKDSMSW
jgi:phage baseplate assembly protein W